LPLCSIVWSCCYVNHRCPLLLSLDHKFELAIDLKELAVARDVLHLLERDSPSSMGEDSTDSQSKWRRLGDLALFHGDLSLALTCAQRSGDSSGLLLMHSCTGNHAGMRELAAQAKGAGRLNVAFLAHMLTGEVESAIELLVSANRLPEAALLARTYLPSQISRILNLWKADLKLVNEKAAEALADPAKYPNLFPDLDWALVAEKVFVANRDKVVPAWRYGEVKGDLDLDVVALVKAQGVLREEVRQEEEKGEVDRAVKREEEKEERELVASPKASPKAQQQVQHEEEQQPATEEEEDLEALLEEESRLLDPQTPTSPAKPVSAPLSPVAAPISPAPVPLSPVPASPVRAISPVPVPVPAAKEEEEEEEDDLDLDLGDLDGDEGHEEDGEGGEPDLLEKDDSAFESGEDW